MPKKLTTSFICANCKHMKGIVTHPKIDVYCSYKKEMVHLYATPCLKYETTEAYYAHRVTITLITETLLGALV